MKELTTREKEVMALVIEGYPVKVIADKLGTKYSTAKAQVYNIFRKLGAKNGAHAAAIYVRSSNENSGTATKTLIHPCTKPADTRRVRL